MISKPIQEFKSLPFRGILPIAANGYLAWTSPLLTTEYPVEGRPAGSDRAICKTVNGFLQANFRDKSVYTDPSVSIRAGLIGEYAGISAVIASTNIDFSSTRDLAIFQSNGGVGFSQWSSFANLAQNIYIRAVIYRNSTGEPVADTPIDVVFSGALLASM
jgi:hypothetical protein